MERVLELKQAASSLKFTRNKIYFTSQGEFYFERIKYHVEECALFPSKTKEIGLNLMLLGIRKIMLLKIKY